MPKNHIRRYKVIRCSKCGRVIARFDRSRYRWHIPKEAILISIRYHYKKYHPITFHRWYK